MLSLDTFNTHSIDRKFVRCSLSIETPPLLVLWQCQSQAWKVKEVDANDLCYHTVSLNSSYYYYVR